LGKKDSGVCKRNPFSDRTRNWGRKEKNTFPTNFGKKRRIGERAGKGRHLKATWGADKGKKKKKREKVWPETTSRVEDIRGKKGKKNSP